MRLGVMGGTFDPIHHGHLVAATEVQALFGLDEVVFVPTGQPWQKDERDVSPAEHRYLMTVVATASNPRFTVSRVDIDRPGPTYTIDTLRDLRAQRPDAELFFITGADALAQILSWKDAEELFELAHFVGVTRPGLRPVGVGPAGRPGHPAGGARPWRSAPPTAGRASTAPSRSGTSCPTASSSTSTNTACMPTAHPPVHRHERRRAVPATERSLELARTAAARPTTSSPPPSPASTSASSSP